jgi:predicted lactoylglutathione lyase
MTVDPQLVVFYVKDTVASSAFYADLLNKNPAELSPVFATFLLKPNFKLGLWSNHGLDLRDLGHCTELGFNATSKEEVDELHAKWQQKKVTMVHPPMDTGFAYTFVATDLDNHRLRVFFPNDME